MSAFSYYSILKERLYDDELCRDDLSFKRLEDICRQNIEQAQSYIANAKREVAPGSYSNAMAIYRRKRFEFNIDKKMKEIKYYKTALNPVDPDNPELILVTEANYKQIAQNIYNGLKILDRQEAMEYFQR